MEDNKENHEHQLQILDKAFEVQLRQTSLQEKALEVKDKQIQVNAELAKHDITCTENDRRDQRKREIQTKALNLTGQLIVAGLVFGLLFWLYNNDKSAEAKDVLGTLITLVGGGGVGYAIGLNQNKSKGK